MKKVIRVLLSRTFIFAIMILLQLAINIVLFYYFARLGSVAYFILSIITALAAIVVFERRGMNPAYKMMWLLLMMAAPVSGVLLFLWWGTAGLPKKKAVEFRAIAENAADAVVQNAATMRALTKQDITMRRSAEYLLYNAAAPVYSNTKCTYFPLGDDFFPAFLDELKKAQRSIFMEYFIIDEGEMWSQTLEVLRQKASEGLDVRILFDSLGCLGILPANYDATLRQMGIQCHAFNPITFSLHITDYKQLNHRDHRKITIIDNETGFTGGLNLADEYINRKVRFGVWKDTGTMLKGPGVYSLTVTFLQMWDYCNRSISRYTDYRPRGLFEADGYVQPYADAPYDDENVSENAYINILQRAESYVYIVTPYLIIDHEMLSALCLAAKSGIDVRIITPGIPDKWYAYYVTQSYYADLLRAGVRIFQYTPGFIHAKMFVSDDKIAVVGSANMDYRSLYLHFENCCAYYGGHIVHDVKKDINETLAVCHEVSLLEAEQVPFVKRILQIFFRLFAPLM